MKELGSEVVRQPEGGVVRQAKSFPTNTNKPKSNSIWNGEIRCLLRKFVRHVSWIENGSSNSWYFNAKFLKYLETHNKKLEPDYHRLKTMVKRSIEQEIRNKNFGSRKGNFEKNAVVKNQGTTACTKNSWRLLATGNQRAVCERRQLQFSPRYG